MKKSKKQNKVRKNNPSKLLGMGAKIAGLVINQVKSLPKNIIMWLCGLLFRVTIFDYAEFGMMMLKQMLCHIPHTLHLLAWLPFLQ